MTFLFLLFIFLKKKTRFFSRFILFVILLNTLSLILIDYSYRINDNFKKNTIQKLVAGSTPYFSAIFIFEFVLKIISMGFIFGKNTYLKNGWNVIDFLVVATSIIGFLPGSYNVSSFRAIRALRPLKAISQLRGMYINYFYTSHDIL